MEKLLGVLVSVFRRGGQILNCLIVVLRNILSVEIELAELVFGVVVATLGGNFEVPYGFAYGICRIAVAVIGRSARGMPLLPASLHTSA